MKLLIRILLIVIILTALLAFSLLHVFVNMNGKFILTEKLSSVFHKDVFVRSLRAQFPFDLVVKGIGVKDLFKIDEVFAKGGMFDIMTGNFTLPELRIKGAVLEVKKLPVKAEPQVSASDTGAAVAPPAKADNLPVEPPETGTFRLPNIIVRHLKVSGSTVNFTDLSAPGDQVKITLKDVDIKIDNLVLPVRNSEITYFKITGKIPWQDVTEDGKFLLQGWVNLFKKDMRAELRIEGIDGIYLYPYYANWLDLEKACIQKVKLNFSSDIIGFNNDVNADCHLELTKLEFKPREEDQPQDRGERIAAAVIDIFKGINKGNIVLDFKFKTRMDSPEFGLDKIIKLAVEDKISQARKSESLNTEKILSMPARIIGGTISTAAGLTKSVINGTMSIGTEFKKAIEGSFSKEQCELDKSPVNQTPRDDNVTVSQ